MFHIAFTPNTTPANALSAKAPTLLGAIGELLKALDVLELDEWFVGEVLFAIKEAVDNLDKNEPAKGTWSDMGCEDDAFSIDIFCADDARYVKLDDDYLLVPHGAVGLAIGELNHQEWLYEMPEVGEWLDVLLPHVVYQPSEDGLDAAVRSVVRGVDWDVFEISKGISQVQRCDESETINDDEAIAEARRCGIQCDDDGFIQDYERCEHTGMTRDELESICGTTSEPTPLSVLRHHVSGAIERGEAVAIVEQPLPTITEVIRNVNNGDCTLSAIRSDGSQIKLFSFYIDELSFSDSELIGLTETQAHELHRKRDAQFLRS